MAANNIDDQNYEDQPVEGDDVVYDDHYEDAETYTEDDSEEWAEGDEVVSEEEPQNNKQKKKSSTLTVIIILVVAIVGVLGFMVLTGGSTAPGPEGEMAQQQGVIDTDAEQPASSDAPNMTGADEPVTNHQNVLDHPASVESQMAPTQSPPSPVSAPAAELNNAGVSPDAPTPSLSDMGSPSEQADVVGTIAPTVKPVSDFPTVDSIKKPNADQGAEQIAAAPTNPVESAPVEANDSSILPVPASNNGSMTAPAPDMMGQSSVASTQVVNTPQVDTKANEAKLTAVEGQLAAAQKKISELEKNLATQQSALEAEQSKVAAAQSAVEDNSEVDALKAKLAELEAKLSQKTPAPTARATEKIVAEQYEEPDTETVADSPKPAAVKAKAPVRPQWSLKSASSNKAILANKATGDLETVRVGDNVSGLGRIVSISDNGSAWVVKGTLGSVYE